MGLNSKEGIGAAGCVKNLRSPLMLLRNMD